jgi:hypothetical protein
MTDGRILLELIALLTPDAAEYLRTGKKPERVTSFGAPPTLTPTDRKFLDSVRANINNIDVQQIRKFFRDGGTGPSFSKFTELKARNRQLGIPSRDRPPTGPLLPGQIYEFNNQTNQWLLVNVSDGRQVLGVVDRAGNLVGEQTAAAPSARQTDAYATTGQNEQRFLQTRSGTDATQRTDEDVLKLLGTPAGSTPLPSTVAAPSGTTTTTGRVVPSGAVPQPTAGGEMAADTGVPPDWEAAAAEMYPQYYAVVKNIPEIADLLRRSLGPPAWSPQKFDAELRKTNWYQTTSASAREWDLKSAADPATYQRLVDDQVTNISTQALNFGIRLSDETVQKLALDSLRWGMGEQAIINSIGMAATAGGTAGATQLREGYYGQSVRRIARQYGVTLADDTFNSFVNRIAVGDETMDSFQDYALNIAKALYPAIADQFDAGRTFNDITDPFRQIAASTLELNPEEIDFTDPKWVTPITYQPDPKTGEQRLMNLAEWGQELRTNRAYGYEYTTNARNQAYDVVERLANLFGRV